MNGHFEKFTLSSLCFVHLPYSTACPHKPHSRGPFDIKKMFVERFCLNFVTLRKNKKNSYLFVCKIQLSTALLR